MGTSGGDKDRVGGSSRDTEVSRNECRAVQERGEPGTNVSTNGRAVGTATLGAVGNSKLQGG